MTIGGYTIGQGDSSYWSDPSFSDQAWPTVPPPAIVLQAYRDSDSGKFVVKLALITRRRTGVSMTKFYLRMTRNLDDPIWLLYQVQVVPKTPLGAIPFSTRTCSFVTLIK